MQKRTSRITKMQSENKYLNILLISIDKKEISEQLKFLKNNNVYKLKNTLIQICFYLKV